MLPIGIAIQYPVAPISVVAPLAHCTAAFLATMIKKRAPAFAIKVALGAFVMARRILDVLAQSMILGEPPVASLAPPVYVNSATLVGML